MKKEILMIYTAYMSQDIAGNNRTNYLPQLLAESGFKVEKVCSNFNHHTKRHIDQVEKDLPYKLTLINSPGYKKNVSIQRYLSQKVYAFHLNKYLKTRTPPDIVFSNVPNLDVAAVARRYAKKHKIKFVIDIRDLWPEAFKMVVNIPIVKHLLFLPQTIKANRIYKSADVIIAVSDTYRMRAKKVNKKAQDALTIYLGTDLSTFDQFCKIPAELKANFDETLLVYVGTLGNSYDLKTVFEALLVLKNKGYKKHRLIILGSGPLETKFRDYAKKLGVNVNFYGRLPYEKMVPVLSSCDIAINPIKKGGAQSITNKHADYAAAALPVVNSQECQEYRELVKKFIIGFNCRNGDSVDMASKIEYLINNEEARIKMGKNHRKLSELIFDREKTYKKFIELL